MTEHLESCSTQHGFDECDCHARHGEASLECNHCGGPAITSPNGLFSEGDADRCESCGFPGTVSVDDSDEYPIAWWNESDAVYTVCKRADCEECAELMRERAGRGD